MSEQWQFLLDHSEIRFDVWALLALIVLIAAVAYFIIRAIQMSGKKKEIQERMEGLDEELGKAVSAVGAAGAVQNSGKQ
jgi:membrane-bound ClpP family serine protease